MTHTERPVDLMMDLRERMVRIETKLDISADKSLEIDIAIASSVLRISALETEATVLKSSIKTLKWIGAGAVAVGGCAAQPRLAPLRPRQLR